MPPNLVYYMKTNQRKEFTFEILKFFKNQFRLKRKILIKPNQVSPEEYPTTTHPETLEATLLFLKNLKLEIFVGDGHAFDVSSRKMKNTPIQKVCEKFEIPFLDFHKEQMEERKTERNFVVNMSNVPFDKFDCIISLPVLKVHKACTITGALKNVVGYFHNKERLNMHTGKKDIHKMVAEANWLLYKNNNSTFHLTIMDAVQTMMEANEIRHGGQPFDLGYMIAGTNPVSLDIYGFKLLKQFTPAYPHKDFLDVKHLFYAIEYGLGTTEYEVKEIKF